jgi:glutamine amidotransferase
MCRYAAYLGPELLLSELIYKPTNSLVHQATEAMQSLTRINADGFGVGWYAPAISPEPAVFKDTSPVWNNYNLGSIAGKIRSPCIFGHIRKASSFDPVTRENCHPFDRGRLLWMHNGDVPGRARLTRHVAELANDVLLAKIRGNTDSEQAFTLFLTHLDDPLERDPETEEMAAAMAKTIDLLARWHLEAGNDRPLETNFCVTDGESMVAARFAMGDKPTPSLFYLQGDNHSGRRRALIASEPLTEGEEWRAVPESSLVVVDRDLEVEVRPLEIRGGSAAAPDQPGGS